MKQYNFEYELPAVVLRKAIDSFRPHAEAQGFTIESEIDDLLPELFWDADAMTQALLNLLSNAVKYTEKEKNITVRAFRDQAHVHIEVEDRGIGIAPAQLPRVFDEFYRVDQKLNSKRQSGVGLGLTLVQHIIQAHQGTISVRSAVGKGSTFRISLPLPPEGDTPRTESEEKSGQGLHQPIENLS